MAERWILTPTGGRAIVLPLTPQRGGCRVTAIRTPPPARRVQYANRSEGALPSSKEWENREVFLELQLARPTDQWRSETHDFGAPAPEAEGDGDPPGWTGNVRRVASDGNPITTMITDLESAIGECAANGGTLRRVLASGQSYTFDVQDIESPDGPLWDLTYYVAKATTIQLRATCAPFVRTAEVLLGQGTKVSGQRLLTIGGLQVPGDVPALARLEYSAATVAQSTLFYAIDQPDAPSTATGVQIPASGLLPVPGSSATTKTGSVTAAPRAVPAAGTSAPAGAWSPVAYLRTAAGPPLSVSGSFNVLVRVWLDPADTRPLGLRLRWSGGARESGMSTNATWRTTTPGWLLVNLGAVTAPDGALDGLIERASPNSTSLIVDAVFVVPIDRTARAVASSQVLAGVIAASDTMTGTGNVTGSASPNGGVWVATGSTPDFVRSSNGATRSSTAGTSTTRTIGLPIASAESDFSARVYASVAAYTKRRVGLAIGNAAGIDALASGAAGASGAWAVGLLSGADPDSGFPYVTLISVVGTATPTTHASVTDYLFGGPERDMRLIYSAGSLKGYVTGPGDLSASPSLAAPPTGLRAAVFTTESGYADEQTRVRDLLVAGAGAPDRVLHPAKTATLDSFKASRVTPADYTGFLAIEGDRPYLPPSGRAAIPARVILGTSRDDLRTGVDTTPTDAFTGKVYVTPRWLQLPDTTA